MPANQKKKKKSTAARKKRKKGLSTSLKLTLILSAVVIFGAIGWKFLGDAIENSRMKASLSSPLFFEGIYVDDISLGGMTMDEAKEAVSQNQTTADANYSLDLIHGENTWTLDNSNFVVQFDTDKVLEEAYSIGRSGDSKADIETVRNLPEHPRHFITTMSASQGEMGNVLDEIEDELNKKVKDARIVSGSSDGGLQIAEAEPGYKVDIKKLQEDINDRFARNDFDEPVYIKVDEIKPSVYKADLEGKYTTLAYFTSETTRDKTRNNNIDLALKAIDGTILAPGEEFSMNGITGERTQKKGYQAAGAIRNGVLIEELGGGVCQVSTSIFNAAAMSGLDITERHNHSWPSSYIGKGLDAMVDYPSSDLKFKNNTDGYVCIASWFDKDNRMIKVKIFGIPVLDKDVTVKFRTEVTETTPQPADEIKEDRTLPEGTVVETRAGKEGYKVNTYRQYMKGGDVVKEELLCRSSYKALSTIITVGTGAPETAEEPEQGNE